MSGLIEFFADHSVMLGIGAVVTLALIFIAFNRGAHKDDPGT